MAGLCTYFVAFCPLGEECSWKGKRLGRFLTAQEARDKIKWHIWTSTNHDYDETAAGIEADQAELVQEEDEEPQAKGKGKAGKATKGKANKHEHANKYEPYANNWYEPYAIAASPSAPSMGNHATVLQAMMRSEAAARTAARMSRAAAQGFDAEADVLANEISKLRAM